MRQLLALGAMLWLLAACNKTETTETGIEYQIHQTDENARMVAKGDILSINMKVNVEATDSLLFNSYIENKPFEIPSDEPTLGSIFSLLKKGDSATFFVNADTLYTKSFRQPLPPGISSSDRIKFEVTVNEVFTQEEIRKKIEARNLEFKLSDSLAFEQFIGANAGMKKTASGLRYEVVKASKGKKVSAGNKVTVKYRGTFLDGNVFDQTKEGQPDFVFNVGERMVIPGWDEGLQLMKEGETFRFLIPWNLAYGEFGSGPIPPYSSLLFDVELVKVENK
jgi:FKBP-type peptidyl-prolyl cis-trans isomerase FkpA